MVKINFLMKKKFSFWPCSLQDLSSLTEIKPVPPSVEAQSPNHWIAREFPIVLYFKESLEIIDNV